MIVSNGKWGRKASLTAEWSVAVENQLRSEKVLELELNHAKGWQGADVNFLERMPGLVALTIIHHSIKDVSGIHSQTALKYLDVNTYCKTPIDFAKFPQLEKCVLEWRAKSESLFAHQGVKHVFINKFPYRNLEVLSPMVRLQSLRLASPRLETLQGIEKLQSLTYLGIYLARRLASLNGIETRDGLLGLAVAGCRKISNVAPLEKLQNLRSLHLPDDGDIESFKPLGNLRNLEQLLFYNDTNVRDGDLNPLLTLPKLRDVAFQQRKHYTHRRSDFPEYPGGWDLAGELMNAKDTEQGS